MISLFLGAGFSKWADNLPLAQELFDFNINPYNKRDETRLASFIKYKTEWNAENPEGHAELFIEDALSTKRSKLVLWYITRRLSDPFIGTILGGTQTLMIDDKRAKSIKGVIKAKNFFECIPEINGIITTNYDMLTEYALGTSGFNYGIRGELLKGRGKNPFFPWQGGPVHLKGEISLLKIHGSISWDEKYRYTDGRCGVKGNALIIPPTHGKGPNIMVKDIWSISEDTLLNSEVLIVFGFSFNEYDNDVLDLLERGGINLKQVLIIDIAPKTASAEKIWPNAKISTCIPPSSVDTSFKKWIESL